MVNKKYKESIDKIIGNNSTNENMWPTPDGIPHDGDFFLFHFQLLHAAIFKTFLVIILNQKSKSDISFK